MSVDLQQAIALDYIPTFEAIATIPGEGGISVYRPERFSINELPASALSLDVLSAMLFSVVAAAPNPDGSAVDLDLTMVSVAALSQPGSPEEKRNKARQALLRAVCEHLLPRSAVDGTPFGGLRRLDDLIIFPFPGASPPNPPGQESPAGASSRKRTLDDRADKDLESLLGSLPVRRETSSMSGSAIPAGFLRTMVTPTKQLSDCSLAFRRDQLLLWGLPVVVPPQAQSLHYQHGRPSPKPSQERK